MAWCVTASLQEDDCEAQEGHLRGDFSGTLEDQEGYSQCALHTHTWVHQLNPDGVPATFGGIVLLDGVSRKMELVTRPELCGKSTSCPLLEVSQWAVHSWPHAAFFPPTHTNSVVSCSMSCDISVLLASDVLGFLFLGADHSNAIWKVFHQTQREFSLKLSPV